VRWCTAGAVVQCQCGGAVPVRWCSAGAVVQCRCGGAVPVRWCCAGAVVLCRRDAAVRQRPRPGFAGGAVQRQCSRRRFVHGTPAGPALGTVDGCLEVLRQAEDDGRLGGHAHRRRESFGGRARGCVAYRSASLGSAATPTRSRIVADRQSPGRRIGASRRIVSRQAAASERRGGRQSPGRRIGASRRIVGRQAASSEHHGGSSVATQTHPSIAAANLPVGQSRPHRLVASRAIAMQSRPHSIDDSAGTALRPRLQAPPACTRHPRCGTLPPRHRPAAPALADGARRRGWSAGSVDG
jgi:hypothetical protein